MKTLGDGYYKLDQDELTDKEIINFVPTSPDEPDGIMIFFFILTTVSISTLLGVFVFIASLFIDAPEMLAFVQ